MHEYAPYVSIVIISLVIAVARFRVPSVKPDFSSTGILKVLAHIFVGGLFGAAIAAWDWVPLAIGLALTGIEILAFVIKPEGH